MPALPLDEAGKYVAGAYVVFLTLIVVYVAIIGAKVSRIERDIDELIELDGAAASPAVEPREASPRRRWSRMPPRG